jgi:hypothetical protein
MQVHLRFRDGKECGFIWVKRDADPRLVKARIAHEKFHTVMRLKPTEPAAIIARLNTNLQVVTNPTATTSARGTGPSARRPAFLINN